MRLRGAAPSLTASLLLLAPFFLRTTLAGTAVNVGLKASWNSAPFLLELLCVVVASPFFAIKC